MFFYHKKGLRACSTLTGEERREQGRKEIQRIQEAVERRREDVERGKLGERERVGKKK